MVANQKNNGATTCVDAPSWARAVRMRRTISVMAEVRKVRPGRGGHIAQAIAKAMGESVRPITPGGSPDPSKQSGTTSTSYAVTATSFLVSEEFLLPAPSENADPEDDKRSSTDAGA